MNEIANKSNKAGILPTQYKLEQFQTQVLAEILESILSSWDLLQKKLSFKASPAS